jgi:hypothetical protein
VIFKTFIFCVLWNGCWCGLPFGSARKENPVLIYFQKMACSYGYSWSHIKWVDQHNNYKVCLLDCSKREALWQNWVYLTTVFGRLVIIKVKIILDLLPVLQISSIECIVSFSAT